MLKLVAKTVSFKRIMNCLSIPTSSCRGKTNDQWSILAMDRENLKPYLCPEVGLHRLKVTVSAYHITEISIFIDTKISTEPTRLNVTLFI